MGTVIPEEFWEREPKKIKYQQVKPMDIVITENTYITLMYYYEKGAGPQLKMTQSALSEALKETHSKMLHLIFGIVFHA